MTSRGKHYLGKMSRIERGLGIGGLGVASPDSSDGRAECLRRLRWSASPSSFQPTGLHFHWPTHPWTERRLICRAYTNITRGSL